MITVTAVIKIIIALVLLNVWVLRFKKPTKWRGGVSKNMPEEFKAYGLPLWSMYLVGALKVSSSIVLLISIVFPVNDLPILYLICLLMIGAIFMHFKIRDPLDKSIPAFILLVLGIMLIYFA